MSILSMLIKKTKTESKKIGSKAMMIHNKDRKVFFTIAVFVFSILIFCCSHICEAAGTNLVWDESPESNVEGYYLYYGTESENYTVSVQVIGKSVTSYPIADLSFTPGQTYYIAITAYTDTGEEGEYSNEVIYEEIQPETVTDLQSPTHSIGECFSNPEITVQWTAAVDTGGSGLDGYSIVWDTESDTLPDTTKDIEDVTTVTSSSLSDGIYYFHIRSVDNALNWSDTAEHLGPFCIETSPPPDTIDPTVTIAQPTSAGTYSTEEDSINLGGSASDNIGVTSVTWTNSRGGSGTASGTANWTISNISLQEGDNVITVTAHDAAGNSGTDTLTVTYTPPAGMYTQEFGSATGADYPGTLQDTNINLNTTNYSSDNFLNTYTWPQDKVANAILMKWDLSAIPSSATIQSATLYLYLSSTGGDDLYDLTVHKIINYNPVISACTGYTYDGTDSWTPNTQCYNNIPLAQADIASAEDTKSIDKTYGYKSWSVTNMVQDWVSNSPSNYGMLVNSDPIASSNSNRSFSATESSDPNQRPKLVVTYSVGPDTTPPADVSNFTATPGDGHVTLSWTNPADGDFVGTMVRYRTDGTHPTDHNDGTLVCDRTADQGSNDGFVHSGLQNGTTYYYSAFTYDEVPNYSETAHASATPTASGPPLDTIDPTIGITSPTSGTTYSTEEDSITLSGTAADNVGVTSVTWTNSRGGSGTASGTTSWTISALTLHCGDDNIITVTARDAAGNSASDTLTIDVKPCNPTGLH